MEQKYGNKGTPVIFHVFSAAKKIGGIFHSVWLPNHSVSKIFMCRAAWRLGCSISETIPATINSFCFPPVRKTHGSSCSDILSSRDVILAALQHWLPGLLRGMANWWHRGTFSAKAQNREHLLKIRDNERFHLKPQLAPILKHPLSLQVWTWSDSSVDAPWWWYQGAFSRDMSSRASLCPLAQRPKAGAMLYPFQCLYDFSSNKTVAVCYSLFIWFYCTRTTGKAKVLEVACSCFQWARCQRKY